MYDTVYLHNRSVSPTVRPRTADANIPPGDANAIAQVGRTMPANERTRFFASTGLKRHPNGVTEQQNPGQSFKTFAIPHALELGEPDYPHDAMNVGKMHSMDRPRQMLNGLREGFQGAPIMHACEQTAAILDRNLANKTGTARLLQRFDNVQHACNQLQQQYDAFALNARAVLNATERGHAGNTAVSLPLTRIMSSVWPDLHFKDGKERQAWLARTLRDPKPFIAQSYDALDLGLAGAGHAVSFGKRDAHQSAHSMSEAEKNAVWATMEKADRAYLDAENAFTRGAIPIDPALLKGHSVLVHLRRLT